MRAMGTVRTLPGRAVRGLSIPLWREGSFAQEHARLLLDRLYSGEGVAHGDGEPVLLVPGLLAGDRSLDRLRGWLRRIGYDATPAGIRVNADCTERTVTALEQRTEALAEQTGRKVTLLGQSRGGTLSRVVAYRRPDLVSGLVTMGTPHLDPLAAHPVVLGTLAWMGAAGSAGFPGLLRFSCLDGACCEEVRDDMLAPMPEGMPFVSLYSRRDGIVDWRACLHDDAEHVAIDASHCGMAVSRESYRAVAGALHAFAQAA
jgi:pimeloyl-ACP methyl ester carboxylesterase